MEKPVANAAGSCSVCGDPVVARGLCGRHFQALRARLIAYGKWESNRTDIAPVLAHLDALREAGVGLARVAELAGIPRKTVQALRRQGRVSCFKETAYAVLSVPLPEIPHGEELAAGATIPAVGTMRRLRALACIGYSVTYLADELGVKFQYVSYLRSGKSKGVTAETARKIDALFRRLQMTQGPSESAARNAAGLGWPPPLAWDEETIDDPAAHPVGRRSTKTARVELYKRWRDRGWTDAEIASRFGITASSMSRWRQRQEKLGLIA